MNLTRLELLQQFLKDDPNDPFNWYAIAQEYLSIEPDKALEIFNKLLREHENYLPTYYHAGKLYHSSNQNSLAVVVFEKGIRLAKIQNDYKTLRELQSALDEILYE